MSFLNTNLFVGDIYYFNFQTAESIWDHPCDEYYKKMVVEARQKASQAGMLEHSMSITCPWIGCLSVTGQTAS